MAKKLFLSNRLIVTLLFVVSTLFYLFAPLQVSADSVSWTSGGQPTAGQTIAQTKENYSWCLWGKGMIYNNASPQDMCLMRGESVRFGFTMASQAYLSVGNDETFYPFSGVAVGSWDSAKLIPGTDTLLVRDYISTYGRGLSIFKNLSEKVSKNSTTYELTTQADFTLRRPDNSLMPVKNLAYSLNGEWIVMNTDTGTVKVSTQNYGLQVFAEPIVEDPYLSISNDGEHAARLKGSYAYVYDIETTCGSTDITQILSLAQACPSVDFSSLISTFNSAYIWPGPIVFSPDSRMFMIYFWADSIGAFKIVDIYAPGYSSTDLDEDGLNSSQEEIQGTLDTVKDTDGDGLSDKIESRWYLDRDEIFCGSSECTYPNPITKDLYVEIDWMNDGTRDYKPTSTQISKVVDAFDDQDIIAHFDTGQYGGGNQLPTLSGSLIFAPTDNEVDFYDLKNGTSTISANFNPERRNIWRYMITGTNFKNTATAWGTSGVSYVGDDDSIVSIEKVESFNLSDLDTAIAGTMLHELGHNLCLSDQNMYTGHASECIYSEIDKKLSDNPSVNYESVMNYRYQTSQVDYSHGVNGVPGDHDDWLAVSLGMDDFINSPFEWYPSTQNKSSGSKNRIDRSRMIESIQQ